MVTPALNSESDQVLVNRFMRTRDEATFRALEQNHTTPDTFGEALTVSGEMLPNRGDADGNPYAYIRLSHRIYLLRSFGSNEKNDRGAGDDVVINYLDGNYVSSKELSSWIQSNGTDEEKYMLENISGLIAVTLPASLVHTIYVRPDATALRY